jgi:hypothetical protein
MKIKMIMLLVSGMVFPVLAQQCPVDGGVPPSRRRPPEKIKGGERKVDPRRALERILIEIGVEKEVRLQLRDLQTEHRKRVKDCQERLMEARKNLSDLEKENAGDKQINKAIRKITKIQEEQLRMVVFNRRAMKSLLGEEKYEEFIKKARKEFRKHFPHDGKKKPSFRHHPHPPFEIE